MKSSEESVKKDKQFIQDRNSRDSAPDRSSKKNSYNRKSSASRSDVNYNYVLNTNKFYSKPQGQDFELTVRSKAFISVFV